MKPLLPAFAVLAVAACGGTSDSTDTAIPVERDSAGVRIVENPLPTNLPWWRVDSIPSVRIGVEGGDPNQEFGTIGGVSQLVNGNIVVLDGRGETAFEFRIFDSTGKHIATHGKFGQGPGEYTWVNYFGSTAGDTIAAVDFPNRRLSYLTVAKGYVRSLQLDETALKAIIGNDASGLVETMVPFGDSSYAIMAFHRRPGEGRYDQANSYHLVDLRSHASVELARYDEPSYKQLPGISPSRMTIRAVDAPDPMHVIDVARKRLCAAIENVPQIACTDDKGTRTIIRWHVDLIPFTAADRDNYIRAVRTNMSRSNRLTPAEIDTYVNALEFPAYYNQFSILRIDANGNFWVLERALKPGGGHDLRFRIFAPDGRQIALANNFPASNVGLGSREFFGKSAIIRVFDDTDDVQKVGVFRITRQDQ